MTTWLTHMDDVGLWLAAVVAGFTALGWIARKVWRVWRSARPWIEKAKAVLELAEYELRHNGGGSIKDAVALIQPLQVEAQGIRQAFTVHLEQAAVRDTRLDRVDQALSDLAAAMPVVARSTPHPDDSDPTGP